MFPTVERAHAGAGVQFYVEVPADRIDDLHTGHVAPGPVEQRAWGVRAFTVAIAGYNFMIGTESTS